MLRFLAAALLLTSLGAGRALAIDLDDVAALARAEAAAPYVPPREALPPELAGLDYDGLRDIRYRPERAIWAGLPFELQLFHLGRGLRSPVAIHEVAPGAAPGSRDVRELRYDPAAWDFGRHRFDRSGWTDLGHAGFRVHHALNTPDYKDELVVFLGASYFRALGRGQQYGLSARGLAIDTIGAPPGRTEEFPRFKAFWIERPAPDATRLVIHALLDSPRATGAYRFVVAPGTTTTLDVEARIFLRRGVEPLARLGIAPLTSMYLHGELQPQAVDFRPQVHDSDGLSIAADGEWLWRPLLNPKRPTATSFAVRRLEGFGLMQRDRRFAAYEDTEARYERRPSAWVEPLGDWGPGRVELLLLPTPDETEDNVVAYWTPEPTPAPGSELRFAWRVHWQGEAKALPPGAHAVQTRRGRSWAPPLPGETQFIVDFDGPALRALPRDARVEAVATPLLNARVIEANAYPHPYGGWRMQLRVQRIDAAAPLELRAFLRHGAQALTETWTPLLPPQD
ncbi:MAG: glucan biosynthesis protein G [Rubrivivax sp.]|jgi:glucans biosynthesis protein|nr:glucan biosynthesis protein G [Rubrivivax sp.]